MRKLCALMLVSLLFLSACSIVIEPRGGSGGWGTGTREDPSTIAEIDAAADLTFDNAKETVFKNIAARPMLSGRAQKYLIDKSMWSLTFDNAKEAVMLTLIKNPDFLAEGKQAILENLNKLTFDNAKERVLSELNRRGSVPAEDEVEIIIQPQPESRVFQSPVGFEMTTRTEL